MNRTFSPRMPLHAEQALANTYSIRMEDISFSRIACDVIFGNPRDLCNGTGICKIVDRRFDISMRRQGRCDQAPAFLRISQDAGFVELILWKGMLCPNLYRKHLRQGILRLESACPLPNTFSPEACHLLPGAHAIQAFEKNFIVRIPFTLEQGG